MFEPGVIQALRPSAPVPAPSLRSAPPSPLRSIVSCYARSTLHPNPSPPLNMRCGTRRAGHHRKKYYRRLCQQALRFQGGADVVFAIFGNLERFRVAPYFAKETIADLGAQGVHPKLLLRIAELTKLQRGPGDKGVQHAYKAVVDVTGARDTDLDRSVLALAKAELRAARNAGAQLEAAAAAPGAADQPPPEVAGVQAVTGVAPAAMSEHPMEQAV
eukprot:349855-Chlamydomonas_euryale.AAC.6